MPVINEVPLFVSSPNDCDLEKRAIFEEINHFNQSLGTELLVRIDAFDSRRLYATVGEYAQAGISRQLEDYEIYIGLWRHRRGTPTPVTSSGTEEELEQALRRFDEVRRPYIMTYFWDGALHDEVKTLLKAHGRYFHNYTDTRQLGALFRVHLAKFFRNEYCAPGHSKTTGPKLAKPRVHLTFDVQHPNGETDCVSFCKPVVAVGRNPNINEIVVRDRLVHREQGQFVWDAGSLKYVDLGYDTIVKVKDKTSEYPPVFSEGDSVELPDGTEIVLRAIVV